MDATRFDRISKYFAQRRRVRGPVAQDAHAAQEDPLVRAPELLFVQSFRAGAIAPKAGQDGRYSLSLEAGAGQTIYFSDRPNRIVGATPTDQFLDRLGFPDDNPPNAALVVETAPGETDVAVVELFSPVYDEGTGGVTYEVEVLANWQAELGVGLQEAPTDLAAVASSFGSAHLFIDGLLDCKDQEVLCVAPGGVGKSLGVMGFCVQRVSGDYYCLPCEHRIPSATLDSYWRYWGERCNDSFPEECHGECLPAEWCQENNWWTAAPCPEFGQG